MSSTRADEAGASRPAPAPARFSLSARLTIWYSASASVLALAVSGYLYWALAQSLAREDEGTLADQIRILRVLLRDRPQDPLPIQQELEWESGAREFAKLYLRILDPVGGLLGETPGMPPDLGPARFPPPVPAGAEPRGGAVIRTRSGKVFRLLSAEAALGQAGPARRIIQAALDVETAEHLLADFRRRLFPVLAASLLLAAIVGYRIARRGIRPVEEIAATARRIRSTTLHERLALAGLPAELQALAATFNDMLARLEDSFARLAQFSADIAHELRTPLNNLRGEIEVALGRERTPEEYREVFGSCLEECVRLSGLVESLLFLARAEDPRTQVRCQSLEVARELGAVREFYEPAAQERGVSLTVQSPESVQAELDRTLFQRAVGNLVENALAHTPSGGAVVLRAAREDGRVRVEVADTGCGIPADHLPHLFDRLYRVDRSRTRTTAGAGLGLAIVKSIALLHGGSARIRSSPGQGTTVTLEFRAGPAATGA